MRYQGGKSRISKDISNAINQSVNANSTFVSLFCGTCSVESKINIENKILNDKVSWKKYETIVFCSKIG